LEDSSSPKALRPCSKAAEGKGEDANHGRARELFTQWRENKDVCAVSVVNLTEVLTAPSAHVARLATAKHTGSALASFDEKILIAATREQIDVA
jgi:hypothetical protein